MKQTHPIRGDYMRNPLIWLEVVVIAFGVILTLSLIAGMMP